MKTETLPEGHDMVTHCAFLQLGWESFCGGLFYRSPYPAGEKLEKRVFYSWRAAIAIEAKRHEAQAETSNKGMA